MRRFVCLFLAFALAGCARQSVAPVNRVLVPQAQAWGTRGAKAGEFTEPRAITTSRGATGTRGFVYATDLTGRILKWTMTGKFVTSWKTPKLPYNQPEGPEGICTLPNGNIAFTNTHASNAIIYSPTGKLIRKFGTYGTGRGQFLLVTGIVADKDGFLYCADYGGEFDRISKWTQDGKPVAQWIGHGEGPRQFRRPCGLAISIEGDLLVADIGNHRIQRLDRKTGAYKGSFGVQGRAPGQMNYPYGVAVDGIGNIYTVEYGSHRVQKWTKDGKFVAAWGKPGHGKNQLANPRGITVSKDGTVFVADTKNNRIQKFRFND
ncbi:MAG TPA: hypothetical protein VM821_05445 [Abditibacteriaceae bacterium]|nr:hypothetical protein [Abditibacteriaceae bacterium]